MNTHFKWLMIFALATVLDCLYIKKLTLKTTVQMMVVLVFMKVKMNEKSMECDYKR